MTNPIPNFGMPDTRPGYAFQSPGEVGGIDLSAIVQAIIAGNRLQQGQQGLEIEQQRTDQAGTYQQGLIEQERARQAAAAAQAAQAIQSQGEIGSALQAMMMGGQQVPVGGFRTAMAPEVSLEQAAGMVRPQNVPALVKEAEPVVKRQEERQSKAKAKAAAETIIKSLPLADRSAVELFFAAQESGVPEATARQLFGSMVSPAMIAQIDKENPDWKELPNSQKAELWMAKQKEILQARYAPTPGTSGAAGALQDERLFRRLATLSDDYASRTKPYRDAYRSLSTAVDKAPLAAKGNGAAQVQMLYAFIKAFDPTSVVREGEIALAQRAAPIWTRAKAYAEQYAKNKAILIPTEVVQQMTDLMNDMITEYESGVNQEREGLKAMANFGGLPPAVVEEALPPLRPSKPDASKKYRSENPFK